MSASFTEVETDNEFPTTAERASSERIGQAAGKGFTWLSLCLLAGKLFSFLAQIVLGRILLDDEFGLFAIASSVANFLKIFNDGGVSQVLVQRGATQFQRLSAPAFWIGISCSVFTGGILALAAPGIAAIYGDSRLTPLLLLFALTVVLSAPATVFKAKLRIDLRFQALAWIGTAWFAIRYLSVIFFAYNGFGAMSFVLPLPFVSLLECLANYAVTQITPWKGGWQLALWPSLLGNSLWVMAAAFARGIARNGDYLILGLLVVPSIVGQYFFGYQLTAQFAILMASNIQFVLFPVLSRLATDPARHSRAIIKTVRMMMLVVSPISLLVCITIAPLEALLWHGKWAMAVPLMQIFSLVAPIRLITDIVHAAITARGEFQKSALLFFVEGIVLMLSVWIAAGIVGSDLTGLALIVAFSQAVFSLALTVGVLRAFDISLYAILKNLLPAFGIAGAAAILTNLGVSMAVETDDYVALILLKSLGFLTIFALLFRLMFSSHLQELATAIPDPWGSLVHRAFYLSGVAKPTVP